MKKDSKVVEIKEKKEIKTLETEEMLRLDLYNSTVKEVDLTAEVIRLRNELMTIKNNQQINSLSTKKESLVKKRLELNQQLKEKYEIMDETWGYDPLTGEIKV